jgi:hypothetical protein
MHVSMEGREFSLEPGPKWLECTFKQCAGNSEEIAEGRAFVLYSPRTYPFKFTPLWRKKPST